MRKLCLPLFLLLAVAIPALADDPLRRLSGDFWNWRTANAPFSGDDVNRMERPGGLRDWSKAAIEKRQHDLAGFETRWKQIDLSSAPVAQQTDYKLIGSALARVHWELEINPRWKRDPNFYLDQTLTAVAEALTVPAPFDEKRSREVLTRLENIPAIMQQGEANLDNPPAPFAGVAIQTLDGIRDRLMKMSSALLPSTTLKEPELTGAANRAADALEHFQKYLQDRLPSLPQQTALGRDAFLFFLQK